MGYLEGGGGGGEGETFIDTGPGWCPEYITV